MTSYSPLSAFKHRIELGVPLPFNIRHANRTLLLARGQVIETLEQMEALFERGAVVDMVEAGARAEPAAEAPPEALPAMWSACMDRVGRMLRQHAGADFTAALDEAARPVLHLIERDPDLAIFQVLRQGALAPAHYGVAHSMHTAITSHLVATRLGWSADDTLRVFKAALTMNLSMLELQERLAAQLTPLTSAQREAIAAHPLRSVQMLEAAGIADRRWLDAVAQHHEHPDGTGYPQQLRQVCEFAELVRRADIYTAKLSTRANRGAVPADDAVRDMFQRDAGHPMTAALAKEFGVYPPGCYVMLACGELGIVVKRGQNLAKPIVASMVSRTGEPMIEPLRRDTAQADHGIVGVVSEKSVRVRVSQEKLLTVAGGT